MQQYKHHFWVQATISNHADPSCLVVLYPRGYVDVRPRTLEEKSHHTPEKTLSVYIEKCGLFFSLEIILLSVFATRKVFIPTFLKKSDIESMYDITWLWPGVLDLRDLIFPLVPISSASRRPKDAGIADHSLLGWDRYSIDDSTSSSHQYDQQPRSCCNSWSHGPRHVEQTYRSHCWPPICH